MQNELQAEAATCTVRQPSLVHFYFSKVFALALGGKHGWLRFGL
jgi:hypothetical protein